jgi:hypothetical protein
LTSQACQRNTVRGETINRSRLRCAVGRSRKSADKIPRSAHDNLGLFTCRCNTAS